jgi:hypothetical protein
MAGRAGNNRSGSATRGSSKQSNQPFVDNGENEPRSEPGIDQSKGKTEGKNFNLLVDDVPYFVRAVPFSFNDEARFYISVNSGEEHVFTWDSQLKRLRAIDDASSILPDALEEAISQKLQSL